LIGFRDSKFNVGSDGEKGLMILRRLPTRWNENTIIVNNNVRIDPPYRIEDCKAQKDKKQAEAHIKKVLSGYYERNQSAPTSKPAAVTPALPRKGG
jgi:hypothetical protein